MHQHLPSLRHLRYLSALARFKSFSKAANECNVTQSTLSNGIKELENLLGHPLARRTSRHVSLTAFGLDVLSHGDVVLNEAAHIIHLSKIVAKPMSGILRLGVIPTIAPYHLPEFLSIIKGHYPDLDLRLQENMSHILLEHVNNDMLDAALIAFPYDTKGLETHIIYKDHFSLIARMDDRRFKNGITMDNLDTNDLLVLEDGHCLRDHILLSCNVQKGSNLQDKKFSISTMATLMELVGQGYGYTLLPHMALRHIDLPEGLKNVEFKAPQPYREIGFVWRSDSPLSKDIVQLIEALEN